MTRHSARLITAFLAGSALASVIGSGPASAQGQEILDGLAYLQASQEATGAWGTGGTRLRDTTSVLDSLHLLVSTGLVRDRGDGWLRSARASSFDDGARRLSSLRLSGAPGAMTAGIETALFDARNSVESNASRPNYPEGGWGMAPGHATDVLDTALALRALRGSAFFGGLFTGSVPVVPGAHKIHIVEVPTAAIRVRIEITSLSGIIDVRIREGSDPTLADPFFHITAAPVLIQLPESGLPVTPGTNHIRVDAPSGNSTYTMKVSYETASFDTRELDDALRYLRLSQNGDGGWGIRRGENSQLFTSAQTAQALLGYAGVYDVQGALNGAIAYLAARQNPDGGFGSDAGESAPHETALALLVLQADDPDSTAVADGVAYLLGNQETNGSWDDDPYATALAIRALAGPDPDADGDGVLNLLDCAPANAGAFGDLAVVTDVTVSAGPGTLLSWDDQSSLMGPDTRYDVVTGSLPALRADQDFTGATCLADNDPSPSYADTRPGPGPGQAWYWLIAAQNACGTSGFGMGDPIPDPRAPLADGPCSSPTVAPQVSITDPNDGATVNSQPIAVSGTVSDSWSSVDVNGVAAMVSGHDWTASAVPLVDGPNLITATATGVGGLSSQDTITVTLSMPVDYVIPRNGSVNDIRILTATQAQLDQVAFFQEFQSGVPPGVTYTTTGVTRISATQLRINFTIAVGGSAATGVFAFDVEYVFLNGSLAEVFRRTLMFSIQVTP